VRWRHPDRTRTHDRARVLAGRARLADAWHPLLLGRIVRDTVGCSMARSPALGTFPGVARPFRCQHQRRRHPAAANSKRPTAASSDDGADPGAVCCPLPEGHPHMALASPCPSWNAASMTASSCNAAAHKSPGTTPPDRPAVQRLFGASRPGGPRTFHPEARTGPRAAFGLAGAALARTPLLRLHSKPNARQR
jgi:hypothetical protein